MLYLLVFFVFVGFLLFLAALGSLLSALVRLFLPRRRPSARRPSAAATGTNRHNKSSSRRKIIPRDEGEYVDYEEVRES